MKTVTFISFKDDNTGEIGLGFAGVARHEEMNSATTGLIIAHDIIEHQNGAAAIGTIDDELEALGAIWYVRGQHGELTRDGSGSHYTIAENIASDIVRMFRDYVYGAYVAPRTFRPRGGKVTHQAELDETLAAASSSWRAEIYAEDLDRARPLWEAYSDIAMRRMQAGYAKARRKWERKGHFAANNQFWAIVEAVEPHAKRCEYEGQRFKLSYGNGEANCEEVYDDE